MKGSWAGLQVKSYAWEEPDTGLEKAAGRPLPNRGMCEGPRPAPPARRPAGCAAPSTRRGPAPRGSAGLRTRARSAVGLRRLRWSGRGRAGAARELPGPSFLLRASFISRGEPGRADASEEEVKSIRASTGRVSFLIARGFQIPRRQINIHIYIYFFPSVNPTLT